MIAVRITCAIFAASCSASHLIYYYTTYLIKYQNINFRQKHYSNEDLIYQFYFRNNIIEIGIA